MKVGFDSKTYIKAQSRAIKKRLSYFEKMYLEIGGHLLEDKHATRVLPGYNLKSKVEILKKLKKRFDGKVKINIYLYLIKCTASNSNNWLAI